MKTSEKKFYVRKTLNELEELLLPKGLLKINRSVIVNRTFVYNYSFCEYDTIILRIKEKAVTEIIVSWKRMRQIKNQLGQVY